MGMFLKLCETKLILLLIIIFLKVCGTSRRQFSSSCSKRSSFRGSIQMELNEYSYNEDQNSCWIILVPDDHFVQLKFETFNFNGECQNTYLEIHDKDEVYTLCGRQTIPLPITVFSDVKIKFVKTYSNYAKFELNYEIKEVECSNPTAFHCSNHSCIPASKVCDEVMDCGNGADEKSCATGIASVEGVEVALRKGILWLKKQRTPLKGWRENTVRAIIAMYLSDKSKFNGWNLEEELMAKQIELETAVKLLKTPVSIQVLSLHINALLLTCQDPHRFFGKDLVKLLKDQVETSGNFTHPSAYLALCNAKEEWPTRAASDLLNILNSDSEYTFIGDFQAFAVMAVSCYNQVKLLNETENADLLTHYQKAIKRFKEHQISDGSFGNVHATALITQSLLSSGQEHSKDWKLNASLKYLMNELSNPEADFLSYYLTLPILNGKSFSDIAKVNCSRNSTSLNEVLEAEVKYHTGSKTQIQYSLFVGDNKDIIHTIYLKVPTTFTAFEVMKYAETEDPKYKFQWKKVFDKIDIYKFAQIANDLEIGKFWLLYQGSGNNDSLMHSTSSPDKLKIENITHLVMWYKSVDV